MNSKKRFFQENNSGGDQSKKQRNKFSDWKKYSAKDKSRWPELQQMISIKLNSNEIGYLLDPSAIAEIKADPAKPTYEHFKPSTAKPTETNEEKEARDLTNDVLKSMYKEALSTKTRERKDMQRHFEKYLAIIFEDLVDKAIRDELHDFMTSDCQGMTAEDRCNAVLKHLQNTHGPHSNLDVQQLTNSISELRPDSMGWSKYLMEFNHRITTLESMKQRDPATGTVLRAERPAPRYVPHTPLTGDPAQDQAIQEAHYHATKEEQDKVMRDWPDGGPELNYKPPDQLLKSTLLQLIRHSPIAAIHQIYSDSLKNPTWTWKHLYDQAKLVADDMADGIGGPKVGDGGRAARQWDNSSVTTSPTNSSNSSIRQIRNGDNQSKRQPRCRNCNGPHGSWECPSRKCFYPDCNAPNFASAEERQQHYMDVHAANAAADRNRHGGGRGRGRGAGRGRHGGRGHPGRGGEQPRPVAPGASAPASSGGRDSRVRMVTWSDSIDHDCDLNYHDDSS